MVVINNEEKILVMLEKLTADVSGLKEDVSGLKEDVSGLKEDVSGLKEDVSGLKGDVSGLKEKMEELDARSLRSAVALEGTVIPRLQLLYEGHETIIQAMDELTPKSRVEALEEEVTILRSAFHTLSQRLTALEQAR